MHSAKERGYKNRDEINVSKAGLGDLYEEKIKGFFRSVRSALPPPQSRCHATDRLLPLCSEHLHEDEEIRYIKDGRGYFDVRGQSLHLRLLSPEHLVEDVL